MHWRSWPDSLMGWVAPKIGDLTPVIAICLFSLAKVFPVASSSPLLVLPACLSPRPLAASLPPTSTKNQPVARSFLTQFFLLPCPQSIRGWGTLSVLNGPICSIEVIGAPAPCCCSLSFDDAHCAMRRANWHRVFLTTQGWDCTVRWRYRFALAESTRLIDGVGCP